MLASRFNVRIVIFEGSQQVQITHFDISCLLSDLTYKLNRLLTLKKNIFPGEFRLCWRIWPRLENLVYADEYLFV